MCGHGSITFLADVDTSTMPVDAAVSALIKSLQSRGRHATGMMQCNADGTWSVQKAPVNGEEFNKGRAPVRRDARAIAVHTRWATKGDPEWNRNNHPVAGKNGVLVMHNGVVRDYSLKREKGDPEVDTFLIAVRLGEMRKRQSREGLVSVAKRIVKTAGLVDGSMTLQVALRGSAMLVSTKIRSNPLYYAEAQGVRITASTHEAVKKAFEVLRIEIPTQAYSFETTEKSKKGKPGRTVTHIGTQAQIFEAREGETLVWHEGEHSAVELGALTAESTSYSSAGSSYTPATGAQGSKPRPHGSYVPPPPVAIELFVGDKVKQKYNARLGIVLGKEAKADSKTGLQWYTVKFFAAKVGQQESKGYTATITSMNLELVNPEGKTIPPTPPPATPQQDAAGSGDGSQLGVSVVTGEEQDGALVTVRAAVEAEFERLKGRFFEVIDSGPRSSFHPDDTCELCGVIDQNCQDVEEVLLCTSCQMIQWENA